MKPSVTTPPSRVDRRKLMAIQLLALVAALATVGIAASAPVLLAGMLGVGMLGMGGATQPGPHRDCGID